MTDGLNHSYERWDDATHPWRGPLIERPQKALGQLAKRGLYANSGYGRRKPGLGGAVARYLEACDTQTCVTHGCLDAPLD